MSGASTMRNAIKRVTHKERSQPADRQHLGLLEKHKDYKIRSYDYHKKDDYIKILKKKAKERNPDEFYFQMHQSKVINGVHKKNTDGSLDNDIVKLLKTQDLGYIVHKKAIDDRKIEKLKNNLHMIGDTKVKMHTLFVDDIEEVEQFDAVAHFKTAPELLDRSFNRPLMSKIVEVAGITGDVQLSHKKKIKNKTIKKALQRRDSSYKELELRSQRASKLDTALRELTQQKNLMSKGTKRKLIIDDEGNQVKKVINNGEGDGDVNSGNKVVYKWKRERRK